MIEKFKKEYSGKANEGVYYLSKKMPADKFEDMYIKLRKAEGRVYDDDTVRLLPEISKDHPNYTEWKIRSNSSAKLIKYIKGLNGNLNILELGCGNGWLSNMLLDIPGSSVIGIDINEQELNQAARVFSTKENLVFVYADIFETGLNEIRFDVIVLAGVLMYFDDIDKLIKTLKALLNDNGEIHLVDNALYDTNTLDAAKNNTKKHYGELGLPEMSGIIHHHLLSGFDKYKPEVLYNPKTTVNKIKRKTYGMFESPFLWMKIGK